MTHDDSHKGHPDVPSLGPHRYTVADNAEADNTVSDDRCVIVGTSSREAKTWSDNT